MEIEELLQQIDIVELASKFTELTESNGEFWGISPITYPPECTPSFSVRRETGRFYDFSSGVGGTAITLIEYCNKVSKWEAINWLKEYIGCNEEIKTRSKLSATAIAKQFSRPKTSLKSGKMQTLPDDYMNRYERKDEKLAVWEAEGISREALDAFCVCFDSFSNRLVYPIRAPDGKIVNVGGRTLEPDWKTKGLRKYTYFKGWDNGLQVIYGLYENMRSILEAHQIILFEGAKSVMLARTYGINNAGAILTSHLNGYQLNILIRLGCDVVFALDKDVMVRDDHNINKLKQYVNVSYLWDGKDLLDEKDAPIDKGVEVFNQLFEDRRRLR